MFWTWGTCSNSVRGSWPRWVTPWRDCAFLRKVSWMEQDGRSVAGLMARRSIGFGTSWPFLRLPSIPKPWSLLLNSKIVKSNVICMDCQGSMSNFCVLYINESCDQCEGWVCNLPRQCWRVGGCNDARDGAASWLPNLWIPVAWLDDAEHQTAHDDAVTVSNAIGHWWLHTRPAHPCYE